ncbi:hypothetical protein [Streptomyces sp. NPDC102462]|uniref:hypothetical protein n=1 Tax=Streptomyces sp. NPDC102462 TaxID=3366178 RepID=UPI0037F93C82
MRDEKGAAVARDGNGVTYVRDERLVSYVESLLLPGRSAGHRDVPVTLLTGGRGRGAEDLFDWLERWIGDVPGARVDARGGADDQLVGLLVEIALGLSRPVPGRSLLVFPSFSALLADLPREYTRSVGPPPADSVPLPHDSVPLPHDSVPTSHDSVPMSHDSVPVFRIEEAARALAGRRGTAAGSSSTVSPSRRSLPFPPRRISHRDEHSALDFRLIATTVVRFVGALPRADRETTERRFLDAFFADLRNSYRRYRRRSTSRILLLLENADTPAAGRLLRHLVTARRSETADPADGLVVVAVTADYSTTLRHTGLGPATGAPAHGQQPTEVLDGLRAAGLDLSSRDVEAEVRHAIQESGSAARHTLGGRDNRAFSRTLFELTRGLPTATRRILDTVLSQDPSAPWEEQLRAALARDSHLTRELTEQLLPPGLQENVRQVLALAATVPDLALTREESRVLGADDLYRELVAFRSDPRTVLHLDTGDPRHDGPPRTPHPFLRLLLLRSLPAPEQVHAALRAVAERNGDRGRAAYHALASGDLDAAAAYLDQLLDAVTDTEWCAELARLRRAPLHDVGRSAAWPGPDAYLVALLEGSRHGTRSPRRGAVTRLLAASWISTEPRQGRAADDAGDPFHDPLGDPSARLHHLVRDDLRELALRTPTGERATALLELAERYGESPAAEPAALVPRPHPSQEYRQRRRRTAAAVTAATATLLCYLLLTRLPPISGWSWGWSVAATGCWVLVLLITARSNRHPTPSPPTDAAHVNSQRAFRSGMLRSWGIRVAAKAAPPPPTPDPPSGPPEPSRPSAEAAVEQAFNRVLARLDAAGTATGDENGAAT